MKLLLADHLAQILQAAEVVKGSGKRQTFRANDRQPLERSNMGFRKMVQWYLDNREWWERIVSGDYPCSAEAAAA